MRIVIVNAYTRNNGGDAAILSVIVEQLRQEWPDAQIAIASMEDPKLQPEFDGCQNIGSVRLYNAAEQSYKVVRIVRKGLALAVEICWPHLPKRLRLLLNRILPDLLSQELSALDTADLVIALGGGYLNGKDNLAGNLNIRYLLLPLKLAESFNKPVFLAPQSFGPFGNESQRQAVKRVLNKVNLIMVREDKSFKLLRRMGIDKRLLLRAVDAGFAFQASTRTSSSQKLASNMQVGITARSWLPSDKQHSYESALADFIVTIQKQYAADVKLIPQVTAELYLDDDRLTEKKIAQLVEKAGYQVQQIDKRSDHRKLKSYYDQLDFTVGTRFHSVIFSLTSYVPAIAIEYEHKTSGIMHDLGLDQWVLKIEDVTADKLSEMFKQLVSQRDAYLKQLHKVLPDYVANAKLTGQIMKQRYDELRTTTANSFDNE